MNRMQIEAEFRGLDEKTRTAQFVASTENVVETMFGPEVLRTKGVNLKRYRKNPVVLDAHDRSSLAAVIGKGDVQVDGRQLLVNITYAPTERGEMAWTLVKEGFVRAVSVGYGINRDKVKRIARGETDGEGDSLVQGPALIVREWELLEVSNVPVPADAAAVKRSFYESLNGSESDSSKDDRRETPMLNGITQAMSGGVSQTPPQTNESTPTPVVAAAPKKDEISEELRARRAEANRREVVAITPRGLEAEAEALMLDGLSVDEIRTKLKEKLAARNKPVGTSEPAPLVNGNTPSNQAKWPTELSDDVLLRSLKRSI